LLVLLLLCQLLELISDTCPRHCSRCGATPPIVVAAGAVAAAAVLGLLLLSCCCCC